MTSVEKTMQFGKVAVMMGGSSAEREISLQSGQAVFEALQRQNVDAHIVDPREDLMTQLATGNFDRVFIALHGRGGEDGLMQGLLDTLEIPYTGSGVLGSSLAMDKCRSKRIWQSLEIPTPAFVELNEHSDWQAVVEYLGLPLIVKPVREGSSYGASKVKESGELESAWRQAREYDARVMAESWITGNEYTVPVLGEEILPMIRLETPREFYDYDAKYLADTTQYHCPCGLDADVENDLGKLAYAAFKALDASGWGRVDFMLDAEGKPWLIEVNTIPGMTSHSLVPMSAKQVGMSFDDLTLKILAASL
ncbi:MAG: D-alanine--D-alanine ligase [Gammaproteobacteria bacterium]|nr:MAG: D-alanine--D-alanine ligase [Gammaproteobacteria bacterium]